MAEKYVISHDIPLSLLWSLHNNYDNCEISRYLHGRAMKEQSVCRRVGNGDVALFISAYIVSELDT